MTADFPSGRAPGNETAKSAAFERAQRRLRTTWIVRALCFGIALILFALVFLSTDGSNEGIVPLLRFSAAGLVLTVCYAALRALGLSVVVEVTVETICDLMLIGSLVLETGGATSPFSMLFLLVIGATALVLERRAGLMTAGLAWLLYATICVAVFMGWAGDAPAEGLASALRLGYALGVHLIGFYGVAFLISLLGTRALRAEQELAVTTGSLADLEIFHRDVIESMSSGLVLLDLSGNILSINQTGRGILELEERVLDGEHISELGLFDRATWEELSQEAGSERIRDESTLEGPDGERKFVGYSVGTIRDSEGELRGHSVVFQELTQWRKLQEELGVKERMAAVGELAAGLAHEIGNPLAAISGSVQMLRRTTAGDGPESKLLDIVLKESERLDRTIKSFLRFARPQERSARRFDICLLVRENLDLLRNSVEVHPRHRLEDDLEPESVTLLADRDQIVQVFWNLARNALKAMPEGGTLLVRGRTVGDTYYSLAFHDSGVGMSEEQVHGLFHPFRSYAGGTGIGMAIVYRIVEQHGGQVEVHSDVDRGTTVEVRLPLSPHVQTESQEGRVA